MISDEFNLDISYESIVKILSMDNVFIIPICYVIDTPKQDEIVYIENDEVIVCHKGDFFEKIECANEVLVPISVNKNPSMAMPYPMAVAQKLYFHQSLNQLSQWLLHDKINNIAIVPSYIDTYYDPNKIAAIYFVCESNDISRETIKQINEKFLTANNLPLTNMSPIGTHVYVNSQDVINMYDIAKHLNYIKLKGFTENIIYIDLEIQKKKFDAFNVKKEIKMFMKHFFGDQVWNQ